MTPAKTVKNLQKGFTLIELLVVIGILAILLAIVLIAINPARQFSQANDTKRRSDVNAILNAIDQYAADNAGNLPAGIPQAPAAAANISNAVGGADICALLVTRYLAALPSDPKDGSPTGQVTDCTAAYDTKYTVLQATGGDRRVTVSSVSELTGNPIIVTR